LTIRPFKRSIVCPVDPEVRMIHGLFAIFACPLLGETVSRSLSLPVPGPVIGMILIVIALRYIPRFSARIQPVATGILGHLSLLFVPTGVGVVGHLSALGGQSPAIFLALAVSTALSITIGALVFVCVARATGNADD
jgi:holin-like protein